MFHADAAVTLEADLARRDLTINAMAEDDETGRLIDPFGGRQDLDARLVVTFAPEALPESVQGTLVARDRLLALVPQAHRLAGSPRIALAQLAAEPLVTYPRGSGVRSAIDAAFRAAGISAARITAETIDPLALVELVGAGLGVALASASYAALAGPEVVVVPLSRPGVEHAVTLAWSRERRAAPALDAFLELAADWLPRPPTTVRAT